MSPLSASQAEEIEGDSQALHRPAVIAAGKDELQHALRLEKAALDRFLFGTGPDKRTHESLRVLVLNVARPVSAWKGRPLGTPEAMAYLAKAKAAVSFWPVDHPVHR